MRSHVLEEKFVRQQGWALELELRHPGKFIPRYALVMFHPEIPYGEALRRGQVPQRILDELDDHRLPDGEPDYRLAARLIDERL